MITPTLDLVDDPVQAPPRTHRQKTVNAFWSLNWAILNTEFRSKREERKFRKALANVKKRLNIE